MCLGTSDRGPGNDQTAKLGCPVLLKRPVILKHHIFLHQSSATAADV